MIQAIIIMLEDLKKNTTEPETIETINNLENQLNNIAGVK